ncbi:MAG: hypothetical protein R8M38_09895 [Mariprofundaceae bacterium]
MIEESLFASSERESKLNKHGDIMQLLEEHLDFASISSSLGKAAPRPSREKGGRPSLPTGADGSGVRFATI